MLKRRKLILFYSLIVAGTFFSCQEDEVKTIFEKEVVIQPLEKVTGFEPKQGVEGDTIRVSLDVTSVEDLKPYYILMQYEDRQDTMTVVGEGENYIDFRIPLGFSFIEEPVTMAVKYARQDSLRTLPFGFEFLPLQIDPLDDKYYENDTLTISGANFSKYLDLYDLEVISTNPETKIITVNELNRIGYGKKGMSFNQSGLAFYKFFDIKLKYNDVVVFEATDYFARVGSYEVIADSTWCPFGTARIQMTRGGLQDATLSINGIDLVHDADFPISTFERLFFFQLPNIPLGTYPIEVKYNGFLITPLEEEVIEIVNETYDFSPKELNQGEELTLTVGHWANWNRQLFILRDKDGNIVDSSDQRTFSQKSLYRYTRSINIAPGEYTIELSYSNDGFPNDEPHVLTPLDGNIITIK